MKIWKRVCAQVLIVVCIFSQMGDYVSASTVEKSSPIGIIEESNKEASIIEVEETKQPEKTTEQEKEPEQSESVKVQSVTEIYVDSAEQLQSEHEYANNSDITWIYQNEEAGKLKVTFSEQTQVENGSDFIYVYDANGTQLGSYTGSQLASKTVEVLGDTIKVRLVSDDSTSAYGLSVDHIAAMESIEVQSMPSVTETIIGEFFDFDGLSVVGIYDDTSKEDITKLCNLGTYDVSTKGEKEISVEFSGLYTSFAMYCKEVKFTAIKVKELPKKSFVYYKGKVDLEGLKVVAVDSLGTEYEIDNGYTMSKINTNIVGTQNVTVNYQGLTTSFDMEVKYAFLYTLNSTFIEIKGIENSSVKEVYIPEMVEGLPVRSIANSAFSGKTNLEYVELPNSITSMGNSVFYGCTGLKNVNIPDKLTYIPHYTFYNCKSLKKVMIPENVLAIEDRAFYGCSGIETLTIPVSTTVYRNYYEREGSFYYCSGIKTLHLTKGTGKMTEYNASSPTSSGVSKYYYDRPWHYSTGNLTTVTIAEEIENIGAYAFYNCAAVKELVLPESITEVGASSFASCGALAKINIPNEIKFIPSNAFSYDKSLLEVVIPEGVTSIGYSAFYECTSLQSVNIPEGITAIYGTTFYNCKELKEVVIPDGVTEIGDRAFYGCSGIETLTIPVSATVYRNYNERAGSFYYCSGIKTLNLTKGTGKMAEYTATSPTNSGVSTYYYDRPWHYSVGNLTTVTIEEGIENIGSYAFRDALKVESLTIPSTVETVGDYAFYNCAAVKEFVLPESITEIGASSFSSCEALAKINIPNGIKFIPSNAFSYDKSLLEVVIPEGVTSIGYSAFYECTSLQSVNIPEEITAIYSTTFYNCKKLKEVVIPDSVTEIGDRAFYGCSGIETLTIPVSATVYRNYNERAGSFYYCSGIKTLHLTTGTGKMADYNTANPTSSGVSKYYYDRPWNFSAGNLTTVTIEEGIEHIGAHAFYACSNLEVLEVPDSVRSIGENAFSYCAKLKIFANTGTPAYNYAKANNVPVYSTESITVDTKKITLYTNNTHQLTTTVKMLSGQIDSAATPSWFSSDLTVAGVSDTGVITANGPGRARITATYEGRSVDCEVTVLLTSTSVQLSKVMLELEKSQKATLYATLIPNNSTDMITWESTNPEIASVDNAGRICALQGGVAIITATTESGMVAACTVKVKVKASSVTLDHEEITLYQGESFKLQADMQPYDATDLVAWESSDASIASVDQNGIITTLKKGQATITATTDSGETAQCIVKVKVPVESITLNHTELKLELQDTCKLVADIYPADVEEQISWESSNHDVACVTQDGQVKAVGIGNADITIWVGEKFKATCQVSVEKIDISKFTFTLPSTEYEYSGKGILPEVMNDNGLVVDRDYSVKYSNFTNAGRATVVITGLGDYTGLKEISYMITAKSIQTASISLSSVNYAYTGKAITPGVTLKLLGSTLKNNVDYAVSYHNNTAVGRGEVRVTGKGNYKGSISCQFNIQPKLSTSAQQVYVGGDFTLKVAGGSGTIAWKSSDSKIATVSSTGKVVAKKAGTIVITATRNKVAVTCKVTVKNLALNKTEITKYNGETIALQVIGGTGSIKWSTSNKSIATVSSGGVVTGKKKGTAIISATRNGTTMKCKVTIKEQELSKKTLSLKVKGSSTLKVTGGSGNIKWSTSNKSVATVTSKGVVQGKKKGTATITAIRNGVKMTCKVTVKA